MNIVGNLQNNCIPTPPKLKHAVSYFLSNSNAKRIAPAPLLV